MAYQVTVKGQVTIPKKVRDYLGIAAGNGVEFEVNAQGQVLLRKAGAHARRTPARSPFAALRGTRKTGLCTQDIMNLLRGYDDDANDPGFRKPGK